MSTKYEYESIAHRANGGFAWIPQVVDANQEEWDESGKTFPAIPCTNTGKIIGKPFRARLRGDLYGLRTSGTGDITISNA